jgi:hypothetical protein
MDMGDIFCSFFSALWKNHLDLAQLPSVFLPDNTEPYPLKMKVPSSLLLNKYVHSIQTKPQGHM